MNQEFKITTILKNLNLRAVAISPDSLYYAVSDFYDAYVFAIAKDGSKLIVGSRSSDTYIWSK